MLTNIRNVAINWNKFKH